LHEACDPELLPECLQGNLPNDEFDDTAIIKSLSDKDEHYKKK